MASRYWNIRVARYTLNRASKAKKRRQEKKC